MKHLILAFSVVALTAACSSKQEVKDAAPGSAAKQEPTSAEKSVADGAKLSENPASGKDMFGASASQGLLVVHFDFDKAELSEAAQKKLRKNAEYLSEHPEAKIVIEGHTDERGAHEYNLALGERRAKAVRDYLKLLGVDSSRMETVSYGSEQPLDLKSTESAWSKNRRAEFRELN